MAVTAPERQYLLSQVGQFAQSDLDRLWQQAEQLADAELFFTYIVAAFPEVVDPYHQAAGELAATWFEDALPVSPYIAKVADPLPVDRLAASAKWALGGDGIVGKDRLSGTLQRAVFDGARQTTLLNVAATKSKWSRYASATACDWCRMLSTRGAVYHTEGTAMKAHDHCHCLAVESRT